MKTKKIIVLAIATLLLTSFTLLTDKGNATVEQKQDLYIFMLCKPTADFNYLGSVKINVAWTGKPDEMLNLTIKKVKREYPNANAIIFTSVDMDKADAIQFKE
jgi:hypothetical protein